MKQRIFKGTFLVGIIVWASCLVLIIGALYVQNSNQYALDLKNQTYVIAQSVEKCGMDYFDGLNVADKYRITWIESNGRVKYDSAVGNEDIGNHSDRPEVGEALKTGYGEDVRYSATLSEKTNYSAVRLADGSVLRVSQAHQSIFGLTMSMIQPILLILLLAVVLSLVLAGSIAKKIVEPLNLIDPEHPEQSEVYPEVRPLVAKISEQNEVLNQQIRRLRVDVDEKTKEADFRKEFTANVSHELKTPLTSISGFAEIIKNGIVKPEDIPRFAGRIYDEAQRLITLVVDIIKLSQLDEKQIAAKKERLDLYMVCEEAVYILQNAAEEKNITVKLNGTHIYIEAVQQILLEIIYNLCDNAIKYNKDGGSVTIDVYESEGHAVVKVSDTGIGIPEEDLERVFERFFRVNKSHSKEIGGTGLGLSIVKHGAAYHNANITMDSKLGVGTSITITF